MQGLDSHRAYFQYPIYLPITSLKNGVRANMILFIREHNGWQKFLVFGNCIKRLATTKFERMNGYTKKQSIEWGIL